MTLFSHEATADLEFNEPPRRLYRFLARLGAWTWEWSLGIGIDEDGEVSGSGILIRLELPGWIASPIRRWCYKHMPEWMKAQRSDDISDTLLAALLIRPEVTGLGIITTFDITSGITSGSRAAPQSVTWAEDRLNPRPWRPE